MADTNVTSLVQQADAIIAAERFVVRLTQLNADDVRYGSQTANVWPNAQVIDIDLKTGADPSTAIIAVPIEESDDVVGTVSSAKVHEANGDLTTLSRLTAVQPNNAQNYLFAQVSIFRAAPDGVGVDIGTPVFVGYIVDYDWSGKVDATQMLVICEDARHFGKKAPTQGKIHRNLHSGQYGAAESVYIRAHMPIMNEGQQPNRHVFSNGAADNTDFPQFVNENLNRAYADPDREWTNTMIAEDQVQALWEQGKIANQSTQPHARVWLPGHAFNFLRFIHFDIVSLTRTGTATVSDKLGKPTSAELGHTPSEDDFPVNLSDVMEVPALTYGLGTNGVWNEWYEPRAIQYDAQTGQVTFISGLGEWNPMGVPVIQSFFDLCRKVGNWTLAPSYTATGKLVLTPIKTTPALRELEGGPVPYGSNGGLGVAGGGKAITLTLPSAHIDSNGLGYRPDVRQWSILHSGRQVYNRSFMHGGRRWFQVTLSTLGLANWTDHLGYAHKAYNPPAGEWKPVSNEGSLRPGWTWDQQSRWLPLFTNETDFNAYEDVFRTWIVQDDINWVAVWKPGDTDVPGFRMYFERDRQVLQQLLWRIFQPESGAFRSRPQRMDWQLWRAYQGIPINAAGTATAYGGAGTVGDAVEGKKRWFRCQSSFIPVSDGRIGIRADADARRNQNFPFEDADATASTLCPWAWNGVGANPWPFEMFLTFTAEADEDLYEYMAVHSKKETATGMPIKKYGHAMEIHNEAGSEYGEERVIDSVVDNPHGSSSSFAYRQRVPGSGQPGASDDAVVYRSGAAELKARNGLTMNRHAMSDLNGELTLSGLDLDIRAGEYIDRLTIAGEDAIRIGCIVTKVHHDIIAQTTKVTVETVR